jgi:hypothetical protein
MEWEDVVGIPIRGALAVLAERSDRGCEVSGILEERLAGIVFLASRDEDLGETNFHAFTNKDVDEFDARALGRELRRIAASVALAATMSPEIAR